MQEFFNSPPRQPAPRMPLMRNVLFILDNRLELFAVELQEERERLLRALFLVLGVAVFSLLAVLTLTAAIVLWLWDYSPVGVLSILTLLYAAVGVFLYNRFSCLTSDFQMFPETFDQLRKDRECLEKFL